LTKKGVERCRASNREYAESKGSDFYTPEKHIDISLLKFFNETNIYIHIYSSFIRVLFWS